MLKLRQDNIKIDFKDRGWILLAHKHAMVRSLLHNNKRLGFIKGKDFLDRAMSDHQLLKDSVPCS
jgi:hypothetical protein